MKRICLLGAAIAAVLILGVATALAASPHAAKAGGKKTKTTPATKLICASALTLQVDPGATDVTADSETGNEAGASVCKPTGKGIEFESYTTADSGNITGKWQQWFNSGTLFGTLTLTPSDSAPPTTATSFSAASYTGTFIIKSGTGAYAKATGTGTLKCATQDSVHFACAEAGKMTLPTAATTKG